MPCWEVNTISVEFKAKYKDLLIAACESIGIKNQYASGWYEERGKFCIKNLAIDLETSQATIPNESANNLLNDVRRAYTKACIAKVALKKKFALKLLQNNKIRMRRS